MIHQARTALARLRELFRPREAQAAEQDEEFEFHVDMETAENVRRGMSHAGARRAALLRFGGRERFRQETGDARGVPALDNLVRDVRFALRRLRRAPAFSFGVIATLGVGIGTAAGIGSIVYGVLLRELPYPEPDRLVQVGFHTDAIPDAGSLHSSATYYHFAHSSRSFTALGAYSTSDRFNITDGAAPERVAVASMTPNTFQLLGVRPLLGELLQTADSSASNPRSAILISERLWRRRYGADSSVIGRRIDINYGSRVVVGVLPATFQFPNPSIDIYYPAVTPVNRPDIVGRYSTVIGRLRDGATAASAEAELGALIPGIADRFPKIGAEALRQSRPRVSVTPLREATVAPVRAQLVLLGVLVLVVLLIAFANVVNLFLLRTERAGHEIAIARSLGASGLALAQRFVSEGVVLGLASAVAALPAAALALSTKFGFTEQEIPRLHEVSFTAQTVVLVVATSVLIGAAVGLIALTRSGAAGMFARLRSGQSTSSVAWRRAQDALVAFQVAVALLLLVSAGLLGRSFWNLHRADIGFAPEQAMTFEVSLPWDGYTTYTANAGFHARLMERLAALPGVTSVAAARTVPLAGMNRVQELRLVGDLPDRAPVTAMSNMASQDYFRVMGIPMLAGRSVQTGDLRGVPGLVLSERLAKSLFGTTDAAGRQVRELPRGGETPIAFTVVGVVGDVHWSRIEDGPAPMAYYPILRDQEGLPDDGAPVPKPRSAQFVVRGTQLPSAAMIREVVTELDRRVPPTGIRTLESLVDAATSRVRLTMLLIATAGVAALFLGVVGVYSVVAYAASRRVREFGVRLALGAAPARVGRMVLGDGLRLVAVGTVAGLTAALVTTRFLRALLYEVEPTSVTEFVAATAVMIVVTLLATLAPARRAARTHPSIALRGD